MNEVSRPDSQKQSWRNVAAQPRHQLMIVVSWQVHFASLG